MGVPRPLPWWVDVLQAAEKWGRAPWEISDDPENTLLWYLRWSAYEGEIARAMKDKQKHNKRK